MTRQKKTQHGPRPTNDEITDPMNMSVRSPKAGRNDPCPCGSGGKFKKCCGSKPAAASVNVERRALAAQYNHSGKVFCDRGQVRDGAACFEQAIAVDDTFPDAYNNLGNALSVLGQMEQAIACYRHTLALQPDNAVVHNNLGNTLARTGQAKEAVACYRRALALRLDNAQMHNNLGNVLASLGRSREAIGHYERAIVLQPGNAEAHGNLANALAACGRADEAFERFERALALTPNNDATYSNLLLVMNASARFDAETVFTAHRRYAERFENPLKSSWPQHANDRTPDRLLRIGYVSADLRLHSVAWFIEPVLANHDRERFEIYAYHGHEVEDEVSGRLRSHVTQWRRLAGLSDEEVARGIRKDRIDILVDLNGHTAMNRLLVFARKPAPVQVTWLGYPNTTGLAAMDYRLTDRFADPEGLTERYHTETPWRLPENFSCYRPPESAPEVGTLPHTDSGAITFGSFNNRSKIGPEVIALWARVLHGVPESRLMLKGKGYDDESVQQALRDAFRAHGIDGDRLILHGGNDSHAEHLRRYHEIDIALDPFPYNGTTTTCDALWMGVPVVTLEGHAHVARVGVSLLSHLGLTEWIAHSAPEYVDIAARCAADTQQLAALRRQLRTRVASSPLTNAHTFTRHLESAYRSMWRQWCAVS
jgi:predicted O-linked N-acetylglucosamine transferase (SPINDLY family)